MSDIIFTEQSEPATPGANKVTVYVAADGLLKSKDDAGNVTNYGSGGNSSLTFVFSGTNSDISTYESMPELSLYTPGSMATITTPGVSTTPTLLGVFATAPTHPNVTELAVGSFTVHYETEKAAGNNYYYTYCTVYKRTSGGIETLLLTSDNSSESQANTVLQNTLSVINSSSITLSATDRIIVKIYAVMLSGTASINLYYDGSTDARMSLPLSSFGYVPENVVNKATDLSAPTNVSYPSTLAVSTALASKANLNAPDLTGFVGINNSSAAGSLDVGSYVYNPGTISVTGGSVTGTLTEFTKTFTIGDSITTTTSSGSETKEILTITDDVTMTVVGTFSGTSTNTTYTSSVSGSQFVILPSGSIRAKGTVGPSALNVGDWLYKGDLVTITGTQSFASIRDRTTYNQTTSATGALNSFAAGPNLNATSTGSFGNVRGMNSFPTVLATNTGAITTITGVLSSTQINSGATGTITNLSSFTANPTNSSTTNTITNMFGVQVTATQAAGTLTSYAGVAVNAKPAAATNSSLLLLGTNTIPTGNFSIYNSSTNGNYLAGSIGLGVVPAATANLYISKNITGGNTAYGMLNTGQIQSASVTSAAYYYLTSASSSAGTTTNLYHYGTSQSTLTGTVTNQYGFYVDANMINGANNFGFYSASTALNFFQGNTGIGIAASTSSILNLAASTTTVSSIRIAHGSAPTSPVNGDFWTTTAGLFYRINGATVEPLVKASNLSDVASAQLSRNNINKGVTALADGANIATNCALGNVFSVTLGGNRTLDNPTNQADGATYIYRINQDATGSRTLAYGSAFKWPGGVAPVLTTTASAKDRISCISDGTNMECTYILDVK